MRRVLIIGCSGGGKSTLARALGAKLDLPVIHMDRLFWLPGWVERDTASFRALIADAISGDNWIFEGNSSRTLDLRGPRADTAIWIRQPRWLCLWRAVTRVLKGPGWERPDMAEGCGEKIDFKFYRYIWDFERVSAPQLAAGLARYAPHAPTIELRNDRDIARFLASVEVAAEPPEPAST